MTRKLTAACLLAILASGCASQRIRVEKNWTPGKLGSFHASNELKVTVPEGTKRLRVWFAMPQEEPGQVVSRFQVTCPYPTSIETDSEGNRQVYLELTDPKDREFKVVETFDVTREEVLVDADASRTRPLSEEERAKYTEFLSANANVAINDDVRKLAQTIVGTEQNPVVEARKIYDWELQNVDYWVKDPKNHKPSPTGSTTYCMTNHTGNCSDFHSLYLSLARSRGIPTRMVYGSLFKPELNGKDEDGSYHCWAEFYAPQVGWVPIDAALANIYVKPIPLNAENEKLVRMTTAYGKYDGPDSRMVDYYFGSLDERRIVWCRGRDLTLSPKQDGPAVNALPKAYVEVDGKVGMEQKVWTRKFTYTEGAAK